jgi:hypothetical protein
MANTNNVDKHMPPTAKAHLLAEVDHQLLQATCFPQNKPHTDPESRILYAKGQLLIQLGSLTDITC